MSQKKQEPKIQYFKTTDLFPYAMNAKQHSQSQILQIAASIREFGFNNPVLLDPDHTIIAGHGRVLAAQRLDMTHVPCIVLDHLTEAQRKAYRIADNRLAEIGGGWDMELVKAELDIIGELGGLDLQLTGFDLAEFPSPDLEPFGVETGEERGNTKGEWLSWADRRVPMDEEEAAALGAALDRYQNETGSSYGFVRNLLSKCSR